MKKYFLTHPSGELWPSERLLLLTLEQSSVETLTFMHGLTTRYSLQGAERGGVPKLYLRCVRTQYDANDPRPKEWDEVMLEYNDGTTATVLRTAFEALELYLEQAHSENDNSVEIPEYVAQMILTGYEYGLGEPQPGTYPHSDEGWDWKESSIKVRRDGCFCATGYFDKEYEHTVYETPDLLIHHLADEFAKARPDTVQGFAHDLAIATQAAILDKYQDDKEGYPKTIAAVAIITTYLNTWADEIAAIEAEQAR